MAFYRMDTGSGGGSGNTFDFYVKDAHVAENGHYISDYLDKNLVANKYYVISVNDPTKNSKGTAIVYYAGSAVTVQFKAINGDYSGGNYTVQLTSNTVGITGYGGNWRDMYAAVSALDEDQEYY